MSCSRKLKKEKLLAEPMKKSFRFSWAYKDQYNLYIKTFEANPMDFTLRFYSTNLSPFFLFPFSKLPCLNLAHLLNKHTHKTTLSLSHTIPPPFIVRLL